MNKRKILDKGSYGIVIKNGFASNSISKLFISKQDFKEEIKNHKLLSSIDYNNDFTIKLLNHSYISFDDINIHKKDYKELKEFTKNKRIFQITYEFGGYGLHNLFYENIDIRLFLTNFIKIIEGVKILQENNLIHTDIKLDNILFNNNKFVLIDFGLMKYKEDFLNHIPYLIHNNIIHFPSEFKINSSSFEELNLNLFLNSINIQNSIYKKEFIKLNEYLIKELFDFYKSKHFSINLNKFNVYQLGLVLYQLILIINKEIDKNIFIIIRKMLEPFPYKRIEIKNDFILNLKKILKDE
jgi:serine/threonine protein kinase